MSRSSTIEDRLANYRPTLEDAIARHAAPTHPKDHQHDHDIVEVDWQPAADARSSNRQRLLVGVIAVALVGGLGVIVATRDTPTVVPADSTTAPDAATATTVQTDQPVVDTAVMGAVPGSGQTPGCPEGTETIGVGTLYLGGPASAQNLATNGFIFSLPAGTEPVDVAIKAIELPVLGLECSIEGYTNVPDNGHFSVVVNPPAVPARLNIKVTVDSNAEVVGVTRIFSGVSYDVTNDTGETRLTLLDRVPAGTSRVQVRFKKGDDVWELTADPTVGKPISLTVPPGETDRFPGDPIDWVLFTLLDANDRLVGVGGNVL